MWGITALSRRNSRQESHDLIYGQWNMILETMRRVWDIDLTIPVGWALIIPVFPHQDSGVTDLVHHASVSLTSSFSLCCDPSCDCLTGYVIISALWLWPWSLSIRARNYEACPPCSPLLSSAWSPRHLLPCSGPIIRHKLRYIIRWSPHCVVTTPIVCPLNPVTPRKLRHPPHPVCPHLIQTHRKIIYNYDAWGIL